MPLITFAFKLFSFENSMSKGDIFASTRIPFLAKPDVGLFTIILNKVLSA